jgi:hypothetical protein
MPCFSPPTSSLSDRKVAAKRTHGIAFGRQASGPPPEVNVDDGLPVYQKLSRGLEYRTMEPDRTGIFKNQFDVLCDEHLKILSFLASSENPVSWWQYRPLSARPVDSWFQNAVAHLLMWALFSRTLQGLCNQLHTGTNSTNL